MLKDSDEYQIEIFQYITNYISDITNNIYISTILPPTVGLPEAILSGAVAIMPDQSDMQTNSGAGG